MLVKMAVKLVQCVVAVATLLAIPGGVTCFGRQGGRQGLVLIEANEQNVEGVYHGISGGIYFVSKSEDGAQSIAVTSSEGEPIFVSKKPQSSSVMTMNVGRTKFLAKINAVGSRSPRYSDYVVPQAFHNLVEMAVTQDRVPYPLLQQAGRINANATRQRAVEDLVSRGDADLIVEAAKSLGRAGVMGYENPAALQFYVLAMRLDKIKEQMRMRTQAAETNMYQANIPKGGPYRPYPWSIFRAYPQLLPPGHVQKRQSCSGCTTGRCPYYGDQSDECFGMCGRNCNCWWWLCGDCCVHQGCLDHDQCCRDDFWSFACLAPFWFSCSGYSC